MLEKGTKVRVLGGAFQGRVGVINELDGKGFARVTFGLMSVRLAVDDLTSAEEAVSRTLLRSSHWRPGATPAAKNGRAPASPASQLSASQTGRLRVANPAPLRVSQSGSRSRVEPSAGNAGESSSGRGKKKRSAGRGSGR